MHFLFLPIEGKAEHLFPFFIFHTTALIQLPLNIRQTKRKTTTENSDSSMSSKAKEISFPIDLYLEVEFLCGLSGV